MVTFDQPLFENTCEMMLSASPESTLSALIVRIGGFHFLISFMGAIGNVMNSSCLEHLIVHMLSCRANSIGIRGHLLTLQALYTLLESIETYVSVEELKTHYVSILETKTISVNVSESLSKLVLISRDRCQVPANSGQKLWCGILTDMTIEQVLMRATKIRDSLFHGHGMSLSNLVKCVHSMPVYI
ncbi:hypothetical protein PR048_011531 [Dryococelus australis]|uniref:Uncharacterized protein n=1 Tax=Dryococelus australis TaxID=614101 RepID=A0ABQ9HLU2_9NEOP|nr:hypothetical protein PR048_011531 [Dryococelus australis]